MLTQSVQRYLRSCSEPGDSCIFAKLVNLLLLLQRTSRQC